MTTTASAKRTRKPPRAVIAAIATIGAALLAIGALHAPAGRGLLAKLGGCPVGKASAADIEGVRARALGSIVAARSQASPGRPALGFELGETTSADVHAWAARSHVACAAEREGMLVRCQAVPRGALHGKTSSGEWSEVSFAFRPSDRLLVDVAATSTGLSAEAAVACVGERAARLREALGEPERFGELEAARLGRGDFTTAVTVHRFTDYVAEVTATSFPHGVTVREHFAIVR